MKNHIYFIVSDDLGADTTVIFFDTDKDSLEFAKDKARGIVKEICKNSGWAFDQSIKYQLISLADLSGHAVISDYREADDLLDKFSRRLILKRGIFTRVTLGTCSTTTQPKKRY